MWRDWTIHQRGASEFLKEAISRIRHLSFSLSFPLNERKDKEWNKLLDCPQSADTHAEGALVKDHLQLMWQVFLAIVENKLHLCDIEELRRLKGLEGELDEIEEMIKEKAASFEVFILCHDLGKPQTIHFSARIGSEGQNKNLHNNHSTVWLLNENGRQKNIEHYNKEYKKFVTTSPESSAEETHASFLSAYQTIITYPGFAHAIVHPGLRKIFDQESRVRRLKTDEAEDIFHAIILQEKILKDFSLGINLAAYNYLIRYAVKYGRDVDDFLDLLLATLFLEICAAPHFTAHGINFDLSPVINFLLSEHEVLPGKGDERLKRQKEKFLKIEREKFRQAKLDGNDLMKLFGMKSGREFGKLLAEVQIFAKNQGGMPGGVPERAKEELFRRVEDFRKI